MMGLTPMQAKALAAIRKRIEQSVSPSYDEIGFELGIRSRSGVSRVVHALRERGLIDFIPGKQRTIRVIGEMEGLEQRSDADLSALRDRIEDILIGRAS